MNVLGIGGGLDRIYEVDIEFPFDTAHDAAAVLVVDGKVVCGIEEERLTRMKHSNKFPLAAIKFCLNTACISIDKIDIMAIYGSELFLNGMLKRIELQQPERSNVVADIKSHMLRIIMEEFNYDMPLERIVFVPHHLTHAISAYGMSGMDKSLVLTIDGQGDGISGIVWDADGGRLEEIQSFDKENSLGFFYLEVIQFLGYSMFDEYKVMGLAPYGDPRKYRRIFKKFYSLLPEGKYEIHFQHIQALYRILNPRKKHEPFTQQHKDISAALQEALEEIVLHVLTYFQEKTGHTRLCMAGGVAHNCSLNGKILNSGLFEDIFVQPAAHDAGSVLGAALYVYHQEKTDVKMSKLEHVYWGTEIGDSDTIENTLVAWKDWISYEKVYDITERAAQLLADGSVLGWVQGRSEFGPRALGNRSIIADPRPVENREIINEMVKMREGYRPFAPSVLEEYIHDYFEAPADKNQFPYMNFVLKVKDDKQKLLGAVTHIDGTARVQTVSTHSNLKYWQLIHAFKERTGIPVLLNTSFNNQVEPIVDSVSDAIVCYLTTKLHYLVIGDYLISKKQEDLSHLLRMIAALPIYGKLSQYYSYKTNSCTETTCIVGRNYSDKYNVVISPELHRLILIWDGHKTMEQGMNQCQLPSNTRDTILLELKNLWSKRLINLQPQIND